MTVKVIDISSWQDHPGHEIDFAKVKAAGIVGVMIKFTQGTHYVNPKCVDHAKAAHAAGLLVGAYHVGEPGASTPEAEVAFFLHKIDGLPLSLAIALDLENFGTLDYSQAQTFAQTWLNGVRLHAPYVLVYLNHWLYGHLAKCPWGFKLWAAQFDPDDGVVPFMKQTGTELVDGIPGAVDVSFLTSLRALNLNTYASPLTGFGPIPQPILALGDTGPAVFVLQTLLRSNGYNIDVDGIFGQDTGDSVENFQAGLGIVDYGSVGPDTWADLAPAAAKHAVQQTPPAEAVEPPAEAVEPPAEAVAEVPPTDPPGPVDPVAEAIARGYSVGHNDPQVPPETPVAPL